VPFVAVIRIELHLSDTGSLKGKRKQLLSIRSTLMNKFRASVAEVGEQDLWQRTTLAVSLVGGSATDLEHLVDGIERYFDREFQGGVRLQRRIVSFEDIDL